MGFLHAAGMSWFHLDHHSEPDSCDQSLLKAKGCIRRAVLSTDAIISVDYIAALICSRRGVTRPGEARLTVSMFQLSQLSAGSSLIRFIFLRSGSVLGDSSCRCFTPSSLWVILLKDAASSVWSVSCSSSEDWISAQREVCFLPQSGLKMLLLSDGGACLTGGRAQSVLHFTQRQTGEKTVRGGGRREQQK